MIRVSKNSAKTNRSERRRALRRADAAQHFKQDRKSCLLLGW